MESLEKKECRSRRGIIREEERDGGIGLKEVRKGVSIVKMHHTSDELSQ